MTTKELIKAVATETGHTQVATKEVITETLHQIFTSLAAGNEVKLEGIGVIKVSDRPQRSGVNPKTGEKITIAASKTIKFKASKNLKEAVNA